MSYRGCVIGCGNFARNHFNAWKSLPRAELAAVCDRDGERAREVAARFGVPRWYTDPVEMVRVERPDFADIVTTPETHRQLVEAISPQCRLVICQKPLAESFEDAAAMVAAVAAAGGQLMVHENFRWQKPFREMRARVQAGVVGRPHFARFSFRHGFFDYHVKQPYLIRSERFALLDVGVHLFDLARCFLGDANTIYCRNQRLNPIVRGEDAFTVLLGHQSGATSLVDCSFHSHLVPHRFPQTTATIEGDEGTLDLLEDYVLVQHHRGQRETETVEAAVIPWGEKPSHVVQESVVAFCEHALDVLAGVAEPQPSGADNLKTLALTFAAYESAASGAVVVPRRDFLGPS